MNTNKSMEKVTLYEVWAPVDERRSSSVGFWTDKRVAEEEKKGIGWYGSDGRIVGEHEGIYDPSTNKYYKLVKNVNDKKISDKEWKERMKKSIKEKLSQSELDYLDLK